MTTDRTIGPTPERLRKAGENVEAFTPDENVNHRAIRLLDTHVLLRLSKYEIIDGDEFGAGSQYYADWYYSGLANSGVIDPGRVIVDGGCAPGVDERKLDALNRWQKATKAVGPLASNVLIKIVILQELSLEAYGRAMHRHKSAKLAEIAGRADLVTALRALVAFYERASREDGFQIRWKRRTSKHRASHVEDYRPVIMPADEAS